MPTAEPKILSPTHGMLAAIWERGLPRLRDRLVELESVAKAAGEGSLVSSRREEAANIAHQLAGSLGMFGYTQGTITARAIEGLLEAEGDVDAPKLLTLVAELRASLDLA